jgi:hypothetical protein
MNLIWHIIKKDARRDRGALAVWALLFVGQIALGAVARVRHGANLTDFQMANAVMIFLQVVMGYILVARLVHADPLLGTSSFWPTRPISARRLLAAKALGAVLLFGLLPVLLLLPWWLYCRFGGQDIWWTAVETVGWQFLMIAPAFLVASVTDDLGRLLLWTLLLVVGLLSWMILLQTSRFVLFTSSGKAESGVIFTRLWLAGAIFVGAAGAVAAHQFLTRRLVRSVGFAALGLGIVVLMGQTCYWDWAKGMQDITRPAAAQASAGLVEGLSFSVGQGRISNAFDPKDREPDVNMHVPLLARGLPAGMSFVGEGIDQTWRWKEGLTIKRHSWLGYGAFPTDLVLREHYALPIPQMDPETAQWYREQNERHEAGRTARGLAPRRSFRRGFSDDQAYIIANFRMPKSIAAKLRTQPPAYDASMRVILTRPEIQLELPLKLGGFGAGGSKTVQLVQLKVGLGEPSLPSRPTDPDAAARVFSTVPSVRCNGLWQSAAVGRHMDFSREALVAVNRTTGDISWLGNMRVQRNLQVGGVVMAWESLSLRPNTVVRGGKFVLKDDQWLHHTVLVLLSERKVAQFQQAVTTEQFVLQPEDDEL